jgi:hypothetical protein
MGAACGWELLWGSGYYFYNIFCSYLNDTGYAIELHHNGNLSVFGMNTEEYKILKTFDLDQGVRRNILLDNIMINSSEGDGRRSVDSKDGHIVLQSCCFAGQLIGRNVYAGDVLIANDVHLGDTGVFELDFPERCVIDGMKPENYHYVNANPFMELWSGNKENDLPLGYFTTPFQGLIVQRSTENAQLGRYTAKLLISSPAPDKAGISGISGLSTRIPLGGVCLWDKDNDGNPIVKPRLVCVIVEGTVEYETIPKEFGLYLKTIKIDDTGERIMNVSECLQVNPKRGRFVISGNILITSAELDCLECTIGMNTENRQQRIIIYVDRLHVFMGDVLATAASGSPYWPPVFRTMTKAPRLWDNTEYVKSGVLPFGNTYSPRRMVSGKIEKGRPLIGKWKRGDIIWNSEPSRGGCPGWICVESGEPGKWCAMAPLSLQVE